MIFNQYLYPTFFFEHPTPRLLGSTFSSVTSSQTSFVSLVVFFLANPHKPFGIMNVLSNSALIQASLNAFQKKINECLDRLDIELKKITKVWRVYNAVSSLEALGNYSNAAHFAVIKRREAAVLRKWAAVAAQKERQFDPMNVYATLVDPRGRAKDVRIVYATDAANNYLELHTRKSVFDLFRTDFEHWDENHFRSLPKKCTARLRGVHMQKQVTIRGGRFPAFRSLSQIMSNRNSVSVSAVRSATQTPVKPVNDGIFKKLEDRRCT